ncbi:hypothetical protein FOZ60_006970 [Perkinsus olseni]|uniref:Uncharacterized protein n=1 Tax=Perkinsus olseni TaxID=32597 RepID=A0A7J6PFB0_PEROL|nr:hypothetical protein FOZ60_006970 [Perkinsus olseni]
MPLCESTEYVTSNSLPAGTYKAVRRREGKVCPELPRLIDFELVVTDGERGQLATYSADIGGVGSVTGRRVTGIEEPAELVWYVEDTTRTETLREHLISKGQVFTQAGLLKSIIPEIPPLVWIMGSYSDEQLRTNAAETSGSSTLVTVPDGEYTARVDHFRKFTVDVRTDPQTRQRWVKLIVELCTFEWPVYFSKVLADSREGCLYLDYSNEDHSMDTPLLLACLQAQTISWDSFRICQREGGGWALMFNTESSNDTGAGNLNTSTIEIDLYRVGDSGQLE